MHDTHKFESRYLDTMVGRFPEHEERYRERSPINHIDSLSAPMIVLQGLDDEIVPPNQAELMVNALREKGLPVAYLTSRASSTASGRRRTSAARWRLSCTSTRGYSALRSRTTSSLCRLTI